MSFQVQVHTQDGDCISILEQAYDVRYDAAINETPKVEFSLPVDDPKSGIELGQEIWLYENATLVDKFRILEVKAAHQLDKRLYKIEAMQIIDYLCDNLIHDQTWTGQTVSALLTDLLSYQSRFTLGTVDPACNVTIADEFEADWESILELMKNLQEFCAGCLYVDPVALTVNLREIQNLGEDKGQQLRYRKNIVGLARSMEKKSLITKLYALGGGEGAAKLTLDWLYRSKQDTEKSQDASYGYITIFYYQCHDGWTGFGNALPEHVTVYKNDVDNTSVWFQGTYANRLVCNTGDFDPAATYKVSFNHAQYLLASGSADAWGLLEGTTSAEEATSAEQLLERAITAMDDCKVPRTVYSLDAVDLSYLGDEWSFEKLKLGSKVKVIDEELGIDFADYIVSIKRRDLREPYKIEIDISNSPKNINNYLAAAAKKREISEKKVTTKIPPNLVGDRKVPSPPTNVTGHGFHAGIFISWDKSPSEDVQAYEVYRNTVDEIPASFVFWTQATYFIDECGVGQTYHYWVKAVDFEALKSSAVACADNPISSMQIVTEDMVAGAVTSAKIADGAIVTQKIADLAVETGKLANLAVDVGKLGPDAVIAEKIAAGAVLADKIAANAVVADKIAANAVIADKIAGNAVTAGKLAADLILASLIRTATSGGRVEIVGSGSTKGVFGYNTSNLLQFGLYATGSEAGKAIAGAGNVVIDRNGIELKEMAMARGIGFTRFAYEGWQYYQFWDSIDGYRVYADSPGEASVSQFGYLHLDVDGNNEEAYALKSFTYTTVPLSWDKGRRFKLKLYIDSQGGPLNFDFRVGLGNLIGDPGTNKIERQVTFMIDDSPAGLYASSGDGSAEERTDTEVSLVAGGQYLLEAILDPGNSVKFYVDNVLKATHTTRVPSGTSNADYIFGAHLKTVGDYTRAIDIGPYVFLQEP